MEELIRKIPNTSRTIKGNEGGRDGFGWAGKRERVGVGWWVYGYVVLSYGGGIAWAGVDHPGGGDAGGGFD